MPLGPTMSMIHCKVLGAGDLLFGPAEDAPRICFQAFRKQP
jgi:hypothetical protein